MAIPLGPRPGGIPVGGTNPDSTPINPVAPSGVQVVEVVADWQVTKKLDGVQARRHYVAASEGQAGVALPEPGDALSEDYPNCTCREVVRSKLGGDPRYDEYWCHYDDSIIDEDWLTGQGSHDANEFMGDLPIGIELGGHMESIKEDTGWTWDGGSTPVKQLLYKRVVTATITVTRMVEDIATYVAACAGAAGKVNMTAMGQFPAGTLMFSGATLAGTRNWKGKRLFETTLKFAYLSQDDNGTPRGWQYIRKATDGSLARPKKGDSYMYGEMDLFTALIAPTFAI